MPNRHGLKMIHDDVRLRYDIGGGVLMASTYSKLGVEPSAIDQLTGTPPTGSIVSTRLAS